MRLIDADKLHIKLLDLDFPLCDHDPILDAMDSCTVDAVPVVRCKDCKYRSEWLPKGVFFTSRRSAEDGYWTIEAFDAMRKAEQPWEPDQSLNFPLPMPRAVTEFARIMGVQVDPRTKLNPAYTIDYPASDPENDTGDYYSIRQELQWIAAAHGGNWIITGEGKLLLVPLLSAPEETSYLVTEYGDAITLGGVKILV